jgi:hypothetical protein
MSAIFFLSSRLSFAFPLWSYITFLARIIGSSFFWCYSLRIGLFVVAVAFEYDFSFLPLPSRVLPLPHLIMLASCLAWPLGASATRWLGLAAGCPRGVPRPATACVAAPCAPARRLGDRRAGARPPASGTAPLPPARRARAYLLRLPTAARR